MELKWQSHKPNPAGQ